MIWAILAAFGVPLWLCALAIVTLVFRSRDLRQRPGDVVVRVRRPGKQRWTRAHAVWVSDVLLWRGSPAAWAEQAQQITDLDLRKPTPAEQGKLHRLGPDPVIATMTSPDSAAFDVATTAAQRHALLGPFLRDRRPTQG